MTLLAIIALAIVRLRRLFPIVMLTSLYSLVSASLLMVMDAADVAFTEAAVGAGISTVLLLGTLALTGRVESPPRHAPWLPLIVVTATGAALIYATLDMPHFGDPDAPIHQHVAPRYIEGTPVEIGIPNMVTAVLTSYRGYDTLGETTVIFTAAVGVLLLLGTKKRRRSPPMDAKKRE